jgi:hypothetical protein
MARRVTTYERDDGGKAGNGKEEKMIAWNDVELGASVEWAPLSALDGFPPRPEDCPPGSLIGQALILARQRADDLATLRARRAELTEQLGGYRRTLATVVPESNMVEIAAARAGFDVVGAALRAVAERIPDAKDAVRAGQGEVNHRWAAATGFQASAQQRGRLSTRDLERLRRLVGPWQASEGAGA